MSITSARKDKSSAVLHALGVFVLRNFRADHIDVIGQGHHALEKEIGPTWDLPRHFVPHGVGGGEHDRRGLTGDACDAENRRSQNPGHGVRQHVFANRLPLARAERERAFAQTLRHRAQRFFARGDDRGQDHQAECKPAREKRNVPAKKNDEQSKTEKAEDNGGHAGEIENRDANEPNPSAVAAVFAQINRAADPDDERDDHRPDDQQRGADDAGPDAAGGIGDAVCLHFHSRMRHFPFAELRDRSASVFFLHNRRRKAFAAARSGMRR